MSQSYQDHPTIPMGPKRVLLIIFSGMIIFFMTGAYALTSLGPAPTPTPSAVVATPNMAPLEQVKVAQWIAKNGLNQYGDPLNTTYSDGNPLVDKKTGKTTNLYEYVVLKHPDRPWNK